MDDLISFLRARLDEDERVARHASDGPWARHVSFISGGPTGATRVTQQAQSWNADHIVRHDPARVLLEVEAKRRIIAECIPSRVGGPALELSDALGEVVLAFLAMPYSDHPDYQESWKP